MIIQASVNEIVQFGMLETIGLRVDNNVIYNEHIRKRLFMTRCEDNVVISDSLREIKSLTGLEINPDARDFYLRYGFITPPFTLYKNVYLLAPYVGIVLSSPLTFEIVYPEKSFSKNNYVGSGNDIAEQLVADLESSLLQSEGDYQVLFSAGLDSSLLLGISNRLNKTRYALNCFMASMPEESVKAEKMCAETETVFKKVSVGHDLSSVASKFTALTLEAVADKIALVIPALIAAAEADPDLTLLDGQGADSLFSGLPHDKLYDLYHRRWLRRLCKVAGILPVWKNKSSRIGRKLYRTTKVLKCLSSPTPVLMLLQSLKEDSSVKLKSCNEVENFLIRELTQIEKVFGDFHLVIRYLFMFRILPAREMQKYLLAESSGFKFKLPFLEKCIVDKYFYLDARNSIKQGVYKYPITVIAKKIWPKFLTSSKTSPFQVEFTTEKQTVKQFSLNTILQKIK